MRVRRSTRSRPCLVTSLLTTEPTETDRLYHLFVRGEHGGVRQGRPLVGNLILIL